MPSKRMVAGLILQPSFLSDETLNPYELPHDKTNKMIVRPAKTQISLGIRPVWSVFAVRSMGS